MTRFTRIDEMNGSEAGLENVWEGHKTTLMAGDLAQVHDLLFFLVAPEDLRQPGEAESLVEVILVEPFQRVSLAEGDYRSADVLAGIVVYGRCADMLILRLSVSMGCSCFGQIMRPVIGQMAKKEFEEIRLTNCPWKCQGVPVYLGVSGANSMLASFTMTCNPLARNVVRRSIGFSLLSRSSQRLREPVSGGLAGRDFSLSQRRS
jgi:hypothetical protein